MVVLQVNKFFFEKGGTERYFFSLSDALEKRGHRVVHFSMRHPKNKESPYASYFVSEKDYSRAGPQRDALPAGLSFIRSKEAASRMRRLIEETRPDIAHLHNIYHQITPSIIPVLGDAGIPVLMTLHDYKLICPNYSLFDGRSACYRCRGGRFYMAPLARCSGGSLLRGALLSIEAYWQRITRVYEGIRYFLAPSRFMRDRIVEAGFGEGRVIYIPHFAMPDEWYRRTPDEAAVRGLPRRYVLYFGRLSAEKGLRTLLGAMRLLPEVPLVVCGDGPLREGLESYVSRCRMTNVHFTGHLDKEPLADVIRRSAFVVIPSEYPENAPFTALESMALGAPMIVSDTGGLPELAAMAGGLVYPRGGAAVLAEKIGALWNDEERAVSIGRAAERVARERLAESAHLDRIEVIYNKALREE